MIENTVFDRTGHDNPDLTANAYNAIIGLTLFWGFLVNWMMVINIDVAALQSINPWVFYGGYFASCIAGIMLFTKSSKPFYSFVGYNLVVIPFGTIIALVLADYDKAIISEAIRLTGAVTAVMMILGSIFPTFFKGIGRALLFALLAVIIVEMIEVFILGIHHDFLDWVVVVIFSGYIGYDWARANSIPRTVDNAIDSAAALYMDIINLFLRLVRILGRK